MDQGNMSTQYMERIYFLGTVDCQSLIWTIEQSNLL